MTRFVAGLLFCAALSLGGDLNVSGTVSDPQGKAAAFARVSLTVRNVAAGEVTADAAGHFTFAALAPGDYLITASLPGLDPVSRELRVHANQNPEIHLELSALAAVRESMVITARAVEPAVDLRNAEVFDRTLFSRDDQLFQQFNAGINAGQHEGGGKSLEIRRFGFNLDHGGVNGGLKVLVDNVQQNQGTQGHGQGYLGALKALSPELIQDATVINGPFRAEYGDFSGLGVVHITQRESLPEQYTVRLQGGSYNTGRSFLAFSPDAQKTDAYLAYEGSYQDGPFQNPGRYRRDNLNGNYSRTLREGEKIGFRILAGRNNFFSSGQLPLDLVASGQLDRFGFLDPTQGGRVKLTTASSFYSRSTAQGAVFKADGFVSRSLFDLYSNFTGFLNDRVNGDGFQQHDSRLQEGANTQYTRPHNVGTLASAVLSIGGNYHDNQINVGLYPRAGRDPLGVATRANARVTNAAGYAQESWSLWRNRLLVSGGLRYDSFRFGVLDRVNPDDSGVRWAGRWQGKGTLAFTPSPRLPLTLHLNYGRGINSSDARGVVQRPDAPRVATTDFYQAGGASHLGRVSFSGDVFLIDHSNEQVYVSDDGSFEFKGPSRAYGFEAKTSVHLTRYLALNGGLTKVGNAFYRGGPDRLYVDSAPRFVSNAALTLAGWRGWSGSLRLRATNHYRLDREDPSILASGNTILDLSIAKRLRRGVELNLAVDNAANRSYYETQNYFESRATPFAPVLARIHGTPGFPITVVAGITLHLRGK